VVPFLDVIGMADRVATCCAMQICAGDWENVARKVRSAMNPMSAPKIHVSSNN
jgi:hypothetical protein